MSRDNRTRVVLPPSLLAIHGALTEARHRGREPVAVVLDPRTAEELRGHIDDWNGARTLYGFPVELCGAGERRRIRTRPT